MELKTQKKKMGTCQRQQEHRCTRDLQVSVRQPRPRATHTARGPTGLAGYTSYSMVFLWQNLRISCLIAAAFRRSVVAAFLAYDTANRPLNKGQRERVNIRESLTTVTQTLVLKYYQGLSHPTTCRHTLSDSAGESHDGSTFTLINQNQQKHSFLQI